MSAELARSKASVDRVWQEAVTASYENMSSNIPYEYTLKLWSGSVEKAYVDQWCNVERHGRQGWDWRKIKKSYRGHKDIIAALFSDGRLCALALVKLSRHRVEVSFLEGDPRPDCHMKGVRATVMLDLAVTLGQRYGSKEIHLQPVNSALEVLYIETYGFEKGKDGSGKSVLKRSLL